MIETHTEKEREYLAYIEQHIKTVQSVWLELQKHIPDYYWLDDCYRRIAEAEFQKQKKIGIIKRGLPAQSH